MNTGEKIATGVLVPLAVGGAAVAAYFLFFGKKPEPFDANHPFNELIQCSLNSTEPSEECINKLSHYNMKDFNRYKKDLIKQVVSDSGKSEELVKRRMKPFFERAEEYIGGGGGKRRR